MAAGMAGAAGTSQTPRDVLMVIDGSGGATTSNRYWSAWQAVKLYILLYIHIVYVHTLQGPAPGLALGHGSHNQTW